MAMIMVTNLTDKDITVWDGHTPYHIARKTEESVPLNAYELAIKHNDYKDKILKSSDVEIDEETQEIIGSKSTKEPESEKEPEPVAAPWDSDDWDPSEASKEELDAYVNIHGLHITADTSVEDALEIIIEHRMTS